MFTSFPMGGYALQQNLLSGALDNIITVTPTILIPAQTGASIFITSLLITNSNPDVATVVKITDGLEGNTIWRGYLAKEGGFVVTFPAPLKFSYETAIYVVCETADATVQISASGFKA